MLVERFGTHSDVNSNTPTPPVILGLDPRIHVPRRDGSSARRPRMTYAGVRFIKAASSHVSSTHNTLHPDLLFGTNNLSRDPSPAVSARNRCPVMGPVFQRGERVWRTSLPYLKRQIPMLLPLTTPFIPTCCLEQTT